MKEEIWKPVKEYEGIYSVSNFGDVISLRFDPPKHLYQTTTNCGYKQVCLYKNGKRKQTGVHILVAQCFVDGWFEGAEVNHKDLNKANNKATNLEWTTRSKNQKHQYYLHHPDFKRNRCKKCNIELDSNNVKYCSKCLIERQKELSEERRKLWPSKENLKLDIQCLSILQISKKYGYSDNMIRKMLCSYGLPFKRKDIIEFKKEMGSYIPPKNSHKLPFEKRYTMYEIDGIKKTATAWSIFVGLEEKRVGRYAKRHTYDETIEFIKSFMNK